MAAIGPIDHPAIEVSRFEPVDEIWIVLGLFLQRLEHGAPSWKGHARAPINAAQGPLDPRSVAGGQFIRL